MTELVDDGQEGTGGPCPSGEVGLSEAFTCEGVGLSGLCGGWSGDSGLSGISGFTTPLNFNFKTIFASACSSTNFSSRGLGSIS